MHAPQSLALAVTAAAIVAACSRPATRPEKSPHFERSFVLTQLRRGNLHAHSNLSDGGNSPDEVARWYREHGYEFLFLTDHNLVTEESLAQRLSTPSFLVLRGEEVSMWWSGKQVHVNALCTRTTIGGGQFDSSGDALVRGIRRIQAQHGVALINHPNFDSAIAASDIPAFESAALIEIASGHPYVQSGGDATRPSAEKLWDLALSSGLHLMGAAVDDMHHVDACGDPPAYPGKGWVYVDVPVLERRHICGALAEGLLISSTGVRIARVEVSRERYEVVPENAADRVVFIGSGGGVLAAGKGTYVLKGTEGYVRARVDAADGGHAWTPAVRVIP